MAITDVVNWFAGGASRYMTLTHCMNHDMFWIRLTIALDLLVATGYVLIALHWWRNEAMLPPSPSKTALGTMKNIFVYCGLCGYLFIPIKMYWPAWRLYDIFLAILAYYTWRYALRAHNLRVIYQELGRSAQLVGDLERLREEGRRKSHFLNAISHDLKTPLNGMVLQADLAELSLTASDDNTLREALAEIKSCARTTADLLNRFLEYGRLEWSEEPSKWTRVDLNELLRQVASQARLVAERKGLQLTHAGEASQLIETDRLKLERIVANLVDNAIKFTQEGFVRLRVEPVRRACGSTSRIRGVGSRSNTSRRSSTTSPRCITVSATAERATGWVWPSPGGWRGSSAAIWPSRASRAAAADSPSRSTPGEPRPGSSTPAANRADPPGSARRRLLIVEDDRATASALRAIFERKGWQVTLVSTLAEAFPLLESPPDCVILDLMLPDGDGVELLARVRAGGLPIRVAVTTGSSDFEQLKAVADLRPEVFLCKPISLPDLLAGLGCDS